MFYFLFIYSLVITPNTGSFAWGEVIRQLQKNERVYHLNITGWQIKGNKRVFGVA
jgi:hypothetical protein